MRNNPIPKQLKAARTKAGISQRELGVRVGMDESSASGRMNHYEKGRHVPDIDTLRKLAKELGVPLNYFFCEDELSAEIICLLEQLDNKDKKKLLNSLKAGFLTDKL